MYILGSIHKVAFCHFLLRWRTGPGPWFNIKMSSYQYRKSHYGDKTILRPSYLHNGISYTGKMIYLHWIRVQFTYWRMDYLALIGIGASFLLWRVMDFRLIAINAMAVKLFKISNACRQLFRNTWNCNTCLTNTSPNEHSYAIKAMAKGIFRMNNRIKIGLLTTTPQLQQDDGKWRQEFRIW